MSPVDIGESGPIVPKVGKTSPKIPLPPRKPAPAFDNPDGDGFVIAFAEIPGLTAKGVLAKPFYFQCPPTEEFGPDFGWTFNDYTTLDRKTHSNPSSRNLTTVSFTTLLVEESWIDPRHLPARRGGKSGPRFAVAELPSGGVLGAVKLLKRLGETMTPFAMQAGQINLWGEWEPLGQDQPQMAVTLRSFRPVERAGERDARYLQVSLTEFEDAPDLRAISPPKPPIAGDGHKNTPSTDKNGRKLLARLNTAKLPKGRRTMYELAKHYYGATSAWRLIAKANGIKLTPSTDLWATLGHRRPAPVIAIPARPKAKS